MQHLPFALLLLHAAATAQDRATIPLTVRDAAGASRTLTLGLADAATYGFDAGLGEAPIPPVPPPALFDARLLDPEGRKQYAYDATWVDIRPFVSGAQRDTFHVSCQSGAYPLTLSWSVPQGFCERLTLVEPATGLRTDMLAENAAAVLKGSDGSGVRFLVILEGPKR